MKVNFLRFAGLLLAQLFVAGIVVIVTTVVADAYLGYPFPVGVSAGLIVSVAVPFVRLAVLKIKSVIQSADQTKKAKDQKRRAATANGRVMRVN